MASVGAISCVGYAGGCRPGVGCGPPRYWYGLPPWPGGLYAWRRQFDASAVHPGIELTPCAGRPAASAADWTRLPHGFFAGLRASAVAAADAAAARAAVESSAAGEVSHLKPGHAAGRPWPFRWPPDERPGPVQHQPMMSPPSIGQLLDVRG